MQVICTRDSTKVLKTSLCLLRMEFQRRFQIGFGSIMASGGWDIDACLGRLNNANDLGWRAWECCKKSEYRPGKIHKQRSDSSEILMGVQFVL